MRRGFSSLMAALLGALIGSAHAETNVLMIIVDDLRPEISAYGSEVKTPNIDRLADRGMLFERAYCNSAVCGASRASLLTGIRPGRHRFLRYDTWASKDAPGATVLPQVFKDAGYTTVSLGKVFHHARDYRAAWDRLASPDGKTSWRDYLEEENLALDGREGEQGPAFESYEGEEPYRDERLADLAIETLGEFAESGEPFFLTTGFVKPHLPFNAPKAYWDLYDPELLTLPATYGRLPGIPAAAYHSSGELRAYDGVPAEPILPEAYARKLIHGYYAATSYVDAQIGRVLDALDALGLRDHTVVLLLGDHGYNLGEHSLWCKHANFDHAMRTPLLIDAPGRPDGKRTTALVEYVDLYPTLMELTGQTAPAGQLEGSSLVPVLDDPEATVKDAIVSKYQDGTSLRTDRYLYTEFQKRSAEIPHARMLFDLQADPMETRNLAEDPEHQDLVRQLAAQLRIARGERFEEKPGSLVAMPADNP